ncbi:MULTISPECIES: phytanoyl-CoA dioxygenase family protein [Rhodopseudomonas]|uniref:Phytanoyl-CoA dioxygenase n=1 Tax=Rhodopseudomonas palustris TaxID=1076 RepID=A0A0D7EI15_RHOPL|nr:MULTISPECIES: phytanoyl-CoA dioxygenase family protein [Rhodopseudomonas]KIZ40474.1 phytanoyl-CoA dioxygenase [Rhodopseudomonas palustris]MDF3810997.1 phytanoyl-CoA dioxygenase family protein [Rhodopseudomonas sp. BAL398]WOK15896.1 phytanoyl-CoA dioxygenase family protein [Rhodopseudomonas sp. BAL398]
MPKVLSSAQIDGFWKDGYVAPVRAISTDRAAAMRKELEAFESSTGGPLSGPFRNRSHLLFTWLNELIRDEHIVDAIEDLYGENLLCWASSFFIKEPEDPSFVSWHQDSTYWGLSSPDVVTAWIALSESNKANGALEVVPGSHLQDQIPHRDTFSKNNMLTRGQEVAVDVDPKSAVMLELEPGEMSLHHVRLIHGSAPNPSKRRRIGFAIRYMPTSVRQLEGEDSASLVRGVDAEATFEHEPIPTRDMDPVAVDFHRRQHERSMKILYRGAQVPA